jgi:hypothetical protein
MSTTMPSVPKVTETDILRFLAAARQTIAEVPICWLATRWDQCTGGQLLGGITRIR